MTRSERAIPLSIAGCLVELYGQRPTNLISHSAWSATYAGAVCLCRAAPAGSLVQKTPPMGITCHSLAQAQVRCRPLVLTARVNACHAAAGRVKTGPPGFLLSRTAIAAGCRVPVRLLLPGTRAPVEPRAGDASRRCGAALERELFSASTLARPVVS